MRIDPSVNRLKFDRELVRLTEQRDLLDSRGIFVLGSTRFPIIDLLFVPKHPLRAVVPVVQKGGIILPQGTTIAVDIPSLAARAFKARFDLSDYDLLAPSLDFLDPSNDQPLQYATMFRALEFETQRKAHIVLLDAHPMTGRPFLCLRGIREYHEHPQHSGDQWLLYRENMSLFSIVMSLWRVALDLVRANLLFQPQGIQVQWVAEEKL